MSLHLIHTLTLQGSPGTVLRLSGSLFVAAPVRLCELTLVADTKLEQALIQSIADLELNDCSLLGASQVVARDCCVSITSCRFGEGTIGVEARKVAVQLDRCSFSKQTQAGLKLQDCQVGIQSCSFLRLQTSGVILEKCNNIFIEDCTFDRVQGSAINIKGSEQSANVTLRKNRVSSCGKDGLVLNGVKGEVLLLSNNVEGLGGSACRLECLRGNVVLEANSWVHCSGYGLFVLDAPAKVENCQCYEMQLGGLLLAPGDQELSVVRSVAAGNQEFAVCVVLSSGSVLMEGCHFASNPNDGVRVTDLDERAKGGLELRRCQLRRNRGYGLLVTGARVMLVDSQVEYNGLADVAAQTRDLVLSAGPVSLLQPSGCFLL